MHLPDVLWLALAFESHAHHSAAKAWLAEIDAGLIYFCRLTQQGFLRIASNPKAFGDEAVTLQQAWRLYDAFLSDDRIALLDEPVDLESYWRQLTGKSDFTSKVWSDAYLAAFAIAANLSVVTFDRDFRSFEGVQSTILA
jgi:toxin-antitoxin system PIN domain toxin